MHYKICRDIIRMHNVLKPSQNANKTWQDADRDVKRLLWFEFKLEYLQENHDLLFQLFQEMETSLDFKDYMFIFAETAASSEELAHEEVSQMLDRVYSN